MLELRIQWPDCSYLTGGKKRACFDAAGHRYKFASSSGSLRMLAASRRTSHGDVDR
jgi:hypothetical protein